MFHIYIVEDEPNIIEALRYLFENEGWQVDVISDGALATAAIRKDKPALLVLDYMLPNKSGLSVAKELRADHELADMPILMLSAKGQMKDKQQAALAGIDAFMTKPFANAELLSKIKELMSARASTSTKVGS